VDETTIIMTDKPQNYVIFMRQEKEEGDMAEALVTDLQVVKSRPFWKSNVYSLCWRRQIIPDHRNSWLWKFL